MRNKYSGGGNYAEIDSDLHRAIENVSEAGSRLRLLENMKKT